MKASICFLIASILTMLFWRYVDKQPDIEYDSVRTLKLLILAALFYGLALANLIRLFLFTIQLLKSNSETPKRNVLFGIIFSLTGLIAQLAYWLYYFR